MNFDWAAWHKKFDDLGISTGVNADPRPKFPGSFPEAEDTTPREEEPPATSEPQRDSAHESASAGKSKNQRHNMPQGWRQEMDEEADDPVWKDHLDKLQASGKLRDRKDGYADPDEREDGGSEVEEEPLPPEYTLEELQASLPQFISSCIRLTPAFHPHQEMLTDAECLRKEGNELYKSGKEIDLEAAIETYRRALADLPETSVERARKAAQEKKRAEASRGDAKAEDEKTAIVPTMPKSGIVELTDEQAAALEQEEDRKRQEALRAQQQAEEKERNKANDEIQQIEEKIEEIKGFLYGNISAAYVALNKDSEAVEAASKCESSSNMP